MIASIDIGTNSVLLLIAEKSGDELRAVRDEARITRLGEKLAATGVLADTAMERTLAVLRDYARICHEAGAQEIIALGTAAMRRAGNGSAFAARIEHELGFTVHIIPEEEEAQLTYAASAAAFGRDITVMDIGGGSTEFIFMNSQKGIHENGIKAQSLELGVVTLTERFFTNDPVSSEELEAAQTFIRSFLHEKLDPAFFTNPAPSFIATAGTATSLVAMHLELEQFDAARVHGARLTASDIDALIEKIAALPVAQRLSLKGLQKGREDVILAGALIMREAMRLLGYTEATISDRGVRWGVLYRAVMDEMRST